MNGKNIVLIIFDTLRADLVYQNESFADTPNIDNLIEEGVKFESVYSTAPETASAHASMFTGLYPNNHGVACDTPQPSLRKDVPVIASWLSDHGYDTYGIPGPGKMSSDYDYDRGFDEYFEEYKRTEGLTSFSGIKKFLSDSGFRNRSLELIKYGPDGGAGVKFDELRSTISDNLSTPYFVMANFLQCHSPYLAPRPHMEDKDPHFSRPSYHIFEWLGKKLDMDVVSHEHPDTHFDHLTDYRESINQCYSDSDYLNETEVRTWKKWYAAELEHLDKKLGEFVRFLEAEGELDDTLFIFTADHGELFGEHDLVYHNNFLWDKLLHVPLITLGCNHVERYKDDIVSLIDLFPTICDLVDIEKPDEIDGQSILSESSREHAFAEIGQRDISVINRDWYLTEEQKQQFDRGKKAVWDDEFKYIRYSDGSEAIYEMPHENTGKDIPESRVNKYKKRLNEELSESFPTPPIKRHEVTDSTLQNLRELGYR